MRPPPRWNPPSAEAVERIRQLAERRLSAEEFDAYVHAPMSEAERQEILESVAWFTKRYPTPGERLAAARRASVGSRHAACRPISKRIRVSSHDLFHFRLISSPAADHPMSLVFSCAFVTIISFSAPEEGARHGRNRKHTPFVNDRSGRCCSGSGSRPGNRWSADQSKQLPAGYTHAGQLDGRTEGTASHLYRFVYRLRGSRGNPLRQQSVYGQRVRIFIKTGGSCDHRLPQTFRHALRL